MGFLSYFLMVVFCVLSLAGWATPEIPLGWTLRPPIGREVAASAWPSANNTFSLTFIQDLTRPSLYLPAITYTGSSIPLWTPASNTSISSSGFLTLDSTGDLRLVNGSRSLVWHSSTSNLGVTAAILDETGNLRLVATDISTVWQSYDHPTNTLLATQNFTSGQKLIAGDYTLSFADPADIIIAWNGTTKIYDNSFNTKSEFRNKMISAPWTLYLDPLGAIRVAQRFLRTPFVINYSNDYGSNVLRFLRLDLDGNFRIYSYLNEGNSASPLTQQWAALDNQCDVFAYCGNMGVCFYNGSLPACRCPSPDFEQIDSSNARMGCKRKRDLHTCKGNTTTVELKDTKFLEPQASLMFIENQASLFVPGISNCIDFCIANNTCSAVTITVDSLISCERKTNNFLSGYESAMGMENSYVKVCFPPMSEVRTPISEERRPPPPPVIILEPRGGRWSSRLISLVIVAAICLIVQLEFLFWWFFSFY